jgi:hypothetical protein
MYRAGIVQPFTAAIDETVDARHRWRARLRPRIDQRAAAATLE